MEPTRPIGMVEGVAAGIANGVEHIFSKRFGAIMLIAYLLFENGAPAWMPWSLGICYLVAQGSYEFYRLRLAADEPLNPTIAKAEP